MNYCAHCAEWLEWCDNHRGWEGNDGSTFCDLDYQPRADDGIYEIEHYIDYEIKG